MWIYGTLARTRLDRAAEIVGHAHNTIDVPTCRWCAYVFLNSTRAAVKSIFRGKIESELTANVLMSPSSTQVVRRAKYHNRTRESSSVCCCRPFAIYAVKHEPAGVAINDRLCLSHRDLVTRAKRRSPPTDVFSVPRFEILNRKSRDARFKDLATPAVVHTTHTSQGSGVE